MSTLRDTDTSHAGAGSGAGVAQHTIVRAEYIFVSNGNKFWNTTCHVINRSATSPLTLGAVYILGPGGVNSVLSVHTGLVGVSVPPLGSIQLAIDNTIPGLVAATTPSAFGVRSVVFSWNGPSGALGLTSRMEYIDSSPDHRGHVEIEGHPVVF